MSSAVQDGRAAGLRPSETGPLVLVLGTWVELGKLGLSAEPVDARWVLATFIANRNPIMTLPRSAARGERVWSLGHTQ
jgi:hypothetical protein